MRGLARERTWQVDPAATATDLARRVRWQLEGWITHGGTDAIAAVELAPGGLLSMVEAGRGLWEVKDAHAARAEAALRHAQDLIGPERLRIVVRAGGRDLDEQYGQLPWGETAPPGQVRPWPGALPDPLPARAGTGEDVVVLDTVGAAVVVAARGDLSAAPALVALDGKRVPILAWAGPWPVTERWWDPGQARRYARLQVLLGDGRAALLYLEDRQWRVAGWYD